MAQAPRRQQPEQRREEIVQAAIRLFCEKGYEGTTIRDIAREVGVAEGLIYHYFPSKNDLIWACWQRQYWHGLVIRILQEMPKAPLDVVLRRLIREHLAMLYENANAFRMHAAEMLRNSELAALSQQYHDEARRALAEYLQRQQAAGRIRPDLDMHVVTGAIAGSATMFFMVHGRLEREEWDRLADSVADELTRLLMYGLSVRQPEENDKQETPS